MSKMVSFARAVSDLDRDTKYTDEFRKVPVREGIHLVRLPPRSPNLNAFDKIGVLEPNDLLRTGLASARDLPLRCTLPYREQSSGSRKSTPAAKPYQRPVSPDAAATAPRRDAQLLPPRRLTITDPLFGHYGWGDLVQVSTR